MAQDHGLCRKKRKSVKWTRRTGRHCRPVLQLPTGQFSQLANMLVRSWRTWNEQGKHNERKMNGAKQLNGGKN